jgi:hypothetical protein
LEDEKDYVELVRLRARELISRQRKALEVDSFITYCPTAVGSELSMKLEAERRNRKWLKGVLKSRRIYSK